MHRDVFGDETAVWYRITAEPQVLRYIVEKGSVTIDGISLTVAKVTGKDFSVSVIPHTLKESILGEKRKGSVVNLENDIIGKYVERLLTMEREIQPDAAQKPTLTKEFLLRAGF